MAISKGRAAALSAVSGMLAALGGCAVAPRGAGAPPPLPEYPPHPEARTATTAAAAGTGAPRTNVVAGEVARSAKACCKGTNDCKGKGYCKTDKNACKGQNECKGQGGCKPSVCPP